MLVLFAKKHNYASAEPTPGGDFFVCCGLEENPQKLTGFLDMHMGVAYTIQRCVTQISKVKLHI